MGIVDIALSQEGVKEKSLNEVMYNTWYYGRVVNGGSYPWCAVFVSWCANQAGVPSSVIPRTASVSSLMDFFKSQGRFMPKGSGYMPKAGDILLQKSGGASHTGFVYASDDKQFYTIEGNASDQVKKRAYPHNDYRLTGFGVPNYDGTPMTGVTPSLEGAGTSSGSGSSGGSLGVGNYEYTNYTVKSGDTLDSIAKSHNVTTAMLMFLNNLTDDKIKSGQILQVPVPNQYNSGGVSNPETLTNITKSHTTGVEVSHPVISVEFYGEYGRLASVSSSGVMSEANLDRDIINVSTMRSMSQDCPTFSLSLVWKNDWFHNLSSNDLVIIKMQRLPEPKSTVLVGLIDDVRKSTDYSSGQPQRVVQVTGRGLNKAFINFDVGLIKNVSIDTNTGFFNGLTDISGCDSYDAIKVILDNYVGKAIKYSFGNGKVFENYFNYSGNHHSYETLTNYLSYTSYNGSLWNFIKELGNAPFNETYWEIIGEKPNMIHRRTPFNQGDWSSLKRHTILDKDIVSDNTGRSDLETYTLFSVQLSIGEEVMENMYPPLWYPPFYAKYGITQLSVSTPYQVWTENVDYAVGGFYQELFNFNIKNNVFYNGTLVVKGDNKYKVGQRVIVESDGIEYYVESVSHSFNCYGTWTTSLGVTRGIEPEKRFTAPWGCAEELTPDIMTSIMGQTSGESIQWSELPNNTLNPNSLLNNFYNPLINNGQNPKAPTNKGKSGTATENEENIYKILKSWGLNTAVCSAILANINAESSFSTTLWGDNHTSYGLCQWHNSRCTNLQNFCKTNGYDVSSVDGQMAYLKTELEGGYSKVWNKIKNVTDTAQGAYEAGYNWCVYFEIPDKKESRGKERGNTAKNTYYPKYKGR